jgi:transposase
MPRISPFQIVLSKGERKVLERRARKYTLPYFEVLRAKMILLAAQGRSNDEISASLDIGRDVVSLWRKRFFHERLPGLEERPRPGRPPVFPPEVVVQVKAIACELPATLGVPLSRLSCADIVREVQHSGIVATLSNKTVWRWLHEDAIRPWQHRTWIFPRDPQFISKAGRILDLYARHWEGRPLRDDEFAHNRSWKSNTNRGQTLIS